uniref:CULT domain-containing protein n=1 Tax=Syphacia muris TaxID=451379 RepID=A0A0N5A8N2_9BILA
MSDNNAINDRKLMSIADNNKVNNSELDNIMNLLIRILELEVFVIITALAALINAAHENVLVCRNCGHTIVTSSMLKDFRSPLAERYYNMSILGDQRLVQVLKNPIPKVFNVITAKTANLDLVGNPYSAETWFPKHEWTACVCPQCRVHMGWYFQSGNIQSKSSTSFVGLVLDYLVGADCKYF